MPSMLNESSSRSSYYEENRLRYSNHDGDGRNETYHRRHTVENNLALDPDFYLDPEHESERQADHYRKQNHQGAEEEQHAARQAASVRPGRFRIMLAEALIIAFVLVVAVFMISQLISSNRIYKANLELETLKQQLEDAKEQTASTNNKLDGEISLEDLYAYATGYLGMHEATKNDITVVGDLDQTSNTAPEETASHDPVKVSFHLWGSGE